MYESITYELILQRMIDKVLEQNPNIDTREGSIIYHALAPAAVELQNMYIELDTILNESFADTQTRDYLIKRCAERGIYPEAATKAVLKGEFNIDVPIGSRFSLDTLNYKVIEKISPGIFKLECETYGIEGNQHFGTLIPIEYIEGLTSAAITELLIPGEDEEETEALRKRYFNSLGSQAFGGNIADYKEKTNAIPGVGGVKVYPTPNGVGGTVKLVIIDSTFGVPSSTLLNTVQTAIDPIPNQGKGVGIAPIGHVVTVEGVTATTVNISTNITYQEGWTWADVEPYVHEAIDAYFFELAESWANEENLIVRISQIEIRLLNIAGIIDIADTTINGLAQNLTLGSDNIPVRGEVIG
jgi:uncharacterized phage protein gp47/JayE